MKTAEALQAAPLGIQEQLLAFYGYEITGNKHVICPFCNSKKFRVNIWKETGCYHGICTCGSFPLLKLAEVKSTKQAKEFLDEVDELIGNTSGDFKPKPNKRLQDHMSIFNRGVDIKGTQAHQYLLERGITIRPRQNMRYCESVPYDHQSAFGAIATLLTDDLGRPHKIHYTYLREAKKAPVEMPRKLFSLTEMSPSMSGMLWNPSEVEAVGEGIESCMSFTILRSMPCNPCLNTALLKSFRFGHYVKHGFIAMDNDHNGAGLAAAAHCAHYNILQRPALERVTILHPMTMGYDFNDALQVGDEIGEWVICRK